jgi:hypothetical protein
MDGVPAEGKAVTIPENIRQLVLKLRTQNNYCTHHPIYTVRQRKRMYGIDPEYSSDIVWVDTDFNEASEEESARLEEAYQESYEVPDGWYRTCYQDIEGFVNVFLTEDACQAFIKNNAHRLEHPRMYVESCYRNQELQDLRDWLMSLPVA